MHQCFQKWQMMLDWWWDEDQVLKGFAFCRDENWIRVFKNNSKCRFILLWWSSHQWAPVTAFNKRSAHPDGKTSQARGPGAADLINIDQTCPMELKLVWDQLPRMEQAMGQSSPSESIFLLPAVMWQWEGNIYIVIHTPPQKPFKTFWMHSYFSISSHQKKYTWSQTITSEGKENSNIKTTRHHSNSKHF